MALSQQPVSTSSEHFEESIRKEINYFNCCLDEIRTREGSCDNPLGIIYESLLAHRRRQLSKVVTFARQSGNTLQG